MQVYFFDGLIPGSGNCDASPLLLLYMPVLSIRFDSCPFRGSPDTTVYTDSIPAKNLLNATTKLRLTQVLYIFDARIDVAPFVCTGRGSWCIPRSKARERFVCDSDLCLQTLLACLYIHLHNNEPGMITLVTFVP